MQENNQNKAALPIRRFFASLTGNKEVIDLAVKIQQAVEQGDSCIEYNNVLVDDLISEDGHSGYIVINNNKAGFRRFYLSELFIQDEFSKDNQRTLDCQTLKLAINSLKGSAADYIVIDSTEEIDKQWQAALAFLFHKRYIISGGPGTGKTTTVIRMLLIYQQLYPKNKIALAAPTGKAANRLIHSINEYKGLETSADNKQSELSVSTQTLHRLLGFNPQTNKLKYNQDNPLPYDLLIIDEASMLDISLTQALLKALKPSAQLVLIGDKDQLPAVEAGNVFADLCRMHNKTTAPINLYENIDNNNDINTIDVPNYTELTKNYRFSHGSSIAHLSNALIKHDFTQFKSLVEQPLFNWYPELNKEEKQQKLKQWYQAIPENETALLLSPTNFGENSVDALNQLATELLHKNKTKSEGVPVMVTKNDYTLNIFNGDIGHMRWLDNKWQLEMSIDNTVQHIQLDAIHHWQIAHAISIHKSQGSEYDHILIAIPDNLENELLTNQLLYTAITRAKFSITLWASEQIIKKIMATDANRMTFLN
jgi:exodeoxyribonuclease V alpha subunit